MTGTEFLGNSISLESAMAAVGRKRKSETVDFEQSDVRFGAKQTLWA